MDIKEAMKIVSEIVFIFSGDERVEEALRTVESELGLKPIDSRINSHGNWEPFHYVREGHAEVVRDADQEDINGMVYS